MFYINKLNMSFKEHVIFEDASLELSKPGIYHLVGKNGVGKSVLLKILSGIIEPQSLEVDSNFFDLVCYVNPDGLIFNSLTLLENLLLFSNDNDLIAEMIEEFELSLVKDSKAVNLSAGERQRVCVIQALLNNKPIILLDEPTSHLDWETEKIIYQKLKKYSKNRIIIITSHYKIEDDFLNYKIKIENKKIIVEEHNVINGKVYINNDSGYIDDKLLYDVICFHPKKILYFFKALILALIILILSVVKVDPANIMQYYANYEDRYSFIVRDYYIGDGFDYFFDDLVDNITLEKVDKCYRTQSFVDIFASSFLINDFGIISEYNNETLKDNEIVISDALYYNLLLDESIYKDSTGEHFYLFGKKLYVKDVRKTNYLNYTQLIADEYVCLEKYKEKYNLEYCYEYCYVLLNENCFNDILYCYADIKSRCYFGKQYTPTIVEVFEHDVVMGDEISDVFECVISKGLLQEIAKGDFDSIKDQKYNFLFMTDGESFNMELKIVGITDEEEYYVRVANKDVILDAVTTFDITETYCFTRDVTLEECQIIMDADRFLVNGNFYYYNRIMNNISYTKTNNLIVVCGLLIVGILISVFFYLLEHNVKKIDNALLKENGIDTKKIRKIKFIIKLKNILIFLISFIVLLLIVHHFNIISYIINNFWECIGNPISVKWEYAICFGIGVILIELLLNYIRK